MVELSQLLIVMARLLVGCNINITIGARIGCGIEVIQFNLKKFLIVI